VQDSTPFNQQMRIYHPIKHEWRWIHAISHPVYDKRDECTYFNGIMIDITAQKQAEAALRDNEAMYRTLIETIPHGVQEVDIDGTITFANTTCHQIYGYNEGELLGTSIFDLPASEAEQRELRDYLRYLVEQQPPPALYASRSRTKEGQMIDVQIDWNYKRNKQGRLTGFISVITDITRRKQAEEALRESERQLATLMSNLPGMAYRCRNDRNWTMEFVSDGCLDLTGYQPDDLQHNRTAAYGQLIHRDDQEQVWQTVQEAINAGEPFEIVYRLITAEGQEKWVWERGQAVFSDGDGPAVLEGFVNDITERKQAEDALRESQARLETAVKAGNVGLWDWHLQTNTVYFSPEWKSQIGYADHEISNNFDEWQSRVHPDDLERAIQMVQTYLAEPWPNYQNEFRFRHKDGSYRWILVHASLLLDESGQPYRMLGSHIDITESKQAEERLRQSENRLALAIEATGLGIYDHAVPLDDDTYHSERWAEILGYTLAELPPPAQRLEWVVEQVHPDDLSLLERAYLDFIEGRAPGYEVEIRMRHKSGEWRYVRGLSKAMAYSATGGVTRILGIMEDITERKQAEADLQRYIQRLETLRQIDQAILAAESVEDTAIAALQRLVQFVPCRQADVSLFYNDHQIIERVISCYQGKWSTGDGLRIPVAETTLNLKMLSQGQVHQVEDYLALENISPQIQSIIARRGIRASITIPLIFREELVGVVGLGRAEPGPFSVEEAEIMSEVADQLAVAISNARLLEAERDQRHLAEGLSDTARILNSTLHVEQVLDNILANAGRVVSHKVGDILLLNEDGLVSITRQQGYDQFDQETWARARTFPLDEFPVLQTVAHSGEPLIISDTHANDIWVHVPETDWIRSYVCAPIFVAKQLAGFISLSHTTPQFYTSTHAKRLQLFAEQASFALQNARLFEETQRHAQELEQRVASRTAELKVQYEKQAVIRERQRLARDLHDAVSQTLFSASLLAESIPHLWEHKPDQARQSLTDLHRLNRGALAEMRNLLLELRPAALAQMNLRDLLQQLSNALLGRTRLVVSLEMTGEYNPASEVRVAFYRIAQEALNNIAKHARASQVTITLLSRPGQTRLTIVDDGRGFDPHRPRPGHFGLEIMQERAASIGAALSVNSEPDRGTEIVVSWSKK